MTTNIIEHLENIKIFTDYINSGLDSIERFWEQIDKGKIIKEDTKQGTKFALTFVDYMPTDKKSMELLEAKERKEAIDLSEQYTNYVRNRIETKLDYDYAFIPDKVELSELYEKIIEENGNLQEFLNTSKDVFDQYVKIIGSDLPKDFLVQLSQFEKSGKSNLNELRVDNSESDSNEPTMRNKVESAFSYMLKEDPRKHKKILSDDDFENLVAWITSYFENNFSVPNISKPIKEVNTIKGNVITTFKTFFKNEFPEKTYPDSLFNLYKASFSDYRNDKIKNIKKTSEPKYYKDLIAKAQ